ncbi:hypothetical protein FJ420_21110 [Mesorhizobium sp. B3-1-3]|uniref:hypothetical protein n=1 Tax=unclassified Mesorhizobium TaxID=325217 RepID=UPI001125C353|nr:MULTISPECIES: hypothetical protein [unclassified Mesorhizobium]TPI59893.1 hypothetical protein FJ424_24965 [Mesorhizobium sp. B3-1-8]TPI68195.1 hypothetical protein FJ420_21110 [Mesorhizobium sp. B3-1-3]
MAVPPAAIMARFDADLSMIALEAIGTQQNLLNQSPGGAGPACLLIKSRHGTNPAVFLTQAIPRHEGTPAKIVATTRAWKGKGAAFASNLWQETAEASGSRIAVIQRRFYDLAGWKATPISDAGKKRFPPGRCLLPAP